MPSERHSTDYAWGQDPEAVAFPCSLCDQVTGAAKLAPKAGVPVIDGLVYRITHPLGPTDDMARLRAILARRDARALYALNGEWASFYCPTCDRSYCVAHWRLDIRFEDGGWYGCTYGTCPAGHRLMVDD
jgi:hypothetical protein